MMFVCLCLCVRACVCVCVCICCVHLYTTYILCTCVHILTVEVMSQSGEHCNGMQCVCMMLIIYNALWSSLHQEFNPRCLQQISVKCVMTVM